MGSEIWEVILTTLLGLSDFDLGSRPSCHVFPKGRLDMECRGSGEGLDAVEGRRWRK